MPKIIEYKKQNIDFHGVKINVVTPLSFSREWEIGQLYLHCTEVGCTNPSCKGKVHETIALLYQTNDIRLYLHPTVVTNDNSVSFDTSGDNAVTVEEWEYTMWEKTVISRRLGDKKVSSVEEIIEFALGEDALEWA